MSGNRISIRLKNYDYTQEGAYYVTVCTQDRNHLFGKIINGEMMLNDAGKMVDKWWQRLTEKYATIQIDEYAIMPNHFHGIIRIVGNNKNGPVGADLCVRPDNKKINYFNRQINDINEHSPIKGQTHGSAPTVGTIIQWFKTMITNEYVKNIKNNNWPSFNTRLWQRNFYEHIIRNEQDLKQIREYITNNPAVWKEDEYYFQKLPAR